MEEIFKKQWNEEAQKSRNLGLDLRMKKMYSYVSTL